MPGAFIVANGDVSVRETAIRYLPFGLLWVSIHLLPGCGAGGKARSAESPARTEINRAPEVDEIAPAPLLAPTAHLTQKVNVDTDVTVREVPIPDASDAPTEAPEPRAERMVFTFAGDVAYPNGWRGHEIIDREKHRLFASVQGIVDSGDLNFVNLECPFTTHEPVVKKTYPITCEPKRLSYIVDAGFNLFSLANNHTVDAGPVGMDDTLDLMEATTTLERPLFWGGVGRDASDSRDPSWVKLPDKSLRIAFFALATGGRTRLPSLYDKGLMDRIRDASESGDFVIVSVHHGPEYVHVPWSHAPQRYRAMISSGANLVVGHHPHVVQGVERFQKGLIFYSLGNFSFGSYTRRHLETGARLYSMMARVTVVHGELTRAELIPLYVNNSSKWILDAETLPPQHATPQLLSGAFAQVALDEFEAFSAAIPGRGETSFVRVGDRLFIDLGKGGPKELERPKILDDQAAEQAISAGAGLVPRVSTENERRVGNVAGTPSKLVPGTSMGKRAATKKR